VNATMEKPEGQARTIVIAQVVTGAQVAEMIFASMGGDYHATTRLQAAAKYIGLIEKANNTPGHRLCCDVPCDAPLRRRHDAKGFLLLTPRASTGTGQQVVVGGLCGACMRRFAKMGQGAAAAHMLAIARHLLPDAEIVAPLNDADIHRPAGSA